MPSTIGAWVDIVSFVVWQNHLNGTLPASLSRWSKLQTFQVFGNHFSGGTLPSLPLTSECTVIDTNADTNSFDCPWPDPTTCHKGTGLSWNLPLTGADCTGYSCNAATGQCEIDPQSSQPPSQCIAACHACTGASTQLPADQCNAWIAFYDATGGPHWKHTQPNETNYGKPICSGSRTDPCSCTGFVEDRYPVCNRENTAIVDM